MPDSMEAHRETEPRFVPEASTPRLVEADAERTLTLAPAASDLLTRLEHQAAECGRLHERIDALEQRVRAERDARRRVIETIRRERIAAKRLAERAERAEASAATLAEENARLQSAAAASERAVEAAWSHIVDVEFQLAWATRPLWRKILRRIPKLSGG
jgi:membrane protein involved in colicin uptake